MRIIVSGLLNIETTVKVKKFPIEYFPIDYPFFGVKSAVSGVAYNVARALTVLNNEVQVISYLGLDAEGERISSQLMENRIGSALILKELKETPATVALYDEDGRREIYCDLKDIQEKILDAKKVKDDIEDSEIVVLCNINFNRSLIEECKRTGRLVATDVHVISDIEDEYNKDFMECADILFLSDERLPDNPLKFLFDLKERYAARIIVIGLGGSGALLYERECDKMYHLKAADIGGVVNTIGAGDALFAAFLNYYGKSLENNTGNAVEALQRAELFAALKIRENGAATGFQDEDTVERYFRENEIVVKELQGVQDYGL